MKCFKCGDKVKLKDAVPMGEGKVLCPECYYGKKK